MRRTSTCWLIPAPWRTYPRKAIVDTIPPGAKGPVRFDSVVTTTEQARKGRLSASPDSEKQSFPALAIFGQREESDENGFPAGKAVTSRCWLGPAASFQPVCGAPASSVAESCGAASFPFPIYISRDCPRSD